MWQVRGDVRNVRTDRLNVLGTHIVGTVDTRRQLLGEEGIGEIFVRHGVDGDKIKPGTSSHG